jgi:hypothetical protein
MVLLISYDLNGRERPAAYARVKKYIEDHSDGSIKPLYSQWFVRTEYTPEAWVDALRDNGIVDSNDSLFVCKVTNPNQGQLLQKHWAWLRANL